MFVSDNHAQTEPMPPSAMPLDEVAGAASVGSMRLSWAARSDVGKVRKVNEDRFFVAPGMFIVADGMGGHAAGDVASGLVVEAFAQHAAEVPFPVSMLDALVDAANQSVYGEASHGAHEGMGSTLVGAVVVDNGGAEDIVVFHVGDSRCYLADADGWHLITHDHSHVQELVDSGEIPEESAGTHPLRNVVTRAVGIEPGVRADFVVLEPHQAVRLVLCSDGVSGELSAEHLEEICTAQRSVSDVAGDVLAAVLDGRAADNATVVVVDVGLLDRPKPLDEATGPRIRPSTPYNPGMIHEVASIIMNQPGQERPLPSGLIDEVPL
jgi:PPM family protein phosphatase